MVIDRLDSKIILARLANLTTGRDPAGVWTSHQHDSINHSLLYVSLAEDGVARFNMENAAKILHDTGLLNSL